MMMREMVRRKLARQRAEREQEHEDGFHNDRPRKSCPICAEAMATADRIIRNLTPAVVPWTE